MVIQKRTSKKEKMKKLIEIVNIEIAEDYRKEAMEILQLTTNKHRNDFIEYHKQDNGNICCMVLDRAKYELIRNGKMTLKDGDVFGSPDMWEN